MTTEQLDMQQLTDKIRNWAIVRRLDEADPTKQMLKLLEEAGETASALIRGDIDAAKDGIGDMQVVINILATQIDSSIEECTNIAYNEIKNRTGEMVNGVFVKSSDL